MITTGTSLAVTTNHWPVPGPDPDWIPGGPVPGPSEIEPNWPVPPPDRVEKSPEPAPSEPSIPRNWPVPSGDGTPEHWPVPGPSPVEPNWPVPAPDPPAPAPAPSRPEPNFPDPLDKHMPVPTQDHDPTCLDDPTFYGSPSEPPPSAPSRRSDSDPFAPPDDVTEFGRYSSCDGSGDYGWYYGPYGG